MGKHKIDLSFEKKEGGKKIKCPMNKSVEVIWTPCHLGFPLCSFSGYAVCAKCIKKKAYPPKNAGK